MGGVETRAQDHHQLCLKPGRERCLARFPGHSPGLMVLEMPLLLLSPVPFHCGRRWE